MEPDKLEQMELLVERLVEQHRRMKKAVARARVRVEERDAQFKSLNDRIQRYERERAAMRARLTRIIGRFEQLDLS